MRATRNNAIHLLLASSPGVTRHRDGLALVVRCSAHDCTATNHVPLVSERTIRCHACNSVIAEASRAVA